MALKAEIAGVRVEADTAEELASLIRCLTATSSNGNMRKPKPERKAKTTGQGSLPMLASSTKDEAMQRLHKSIKDPRHRKVLRALASAGEKGATDEQLRDVSNLKGRISGFTVSLVRRARTYGLRPEEVLRRKVFHANGKRMHHYQLTPAMIAAVGATGEEGSGK